MNQRVYRWPWWCCFSWILVIIVILCCWWWPRPVEECVEVTVEGGCFEANLTILDETTVAWATTNNAFAGGDPNPAVDRAYWTGVLFQFGHASKAPLMFASVEFYSGGSLLGSADTTDVDWINIVADEPDLHDPTKNPSPTFPLSPILPSHFSQIDGGKGLPDQNGCFHWRRLHNKLTPKIVMTYWQGPGGFAIEAEQGAGAFAASNEQRFQFKDAFSVMSYKVPSPGADPVEVSAYSFGVGVVDEIRVTYTDNNEDPGSGVKQDPPWPGP